MDNFIEHPKLCTQCILPESFPGISFDAAGVCNFCQKFDGMEVALENTKRTYKQKFLDLLFTLGISSDHSAPPNKGRAYDILMAYSGGKDSTYTMSLLKLQYGLRVLALSFDNGFISNTASSNIKKVTDNLGIDLIFFKPQWGILKKVFSAGKDRELYSKKSLERASTICTSCIGLVKTLCLKTSIEQNIPLIGYGWSPGQAPVQSAIMKNNPALSKMSQQAILNPLREVAGDEIEAYFLQERHYSDPDKFPYNIHPMAWEFYNEEMILTEIQQYGWEAPSDTDSNSTNCLLNAYANDIHLSRYNFHPYVWEIANMVREGVMTREDGYRKIYGKQSSELIKIAQQKLQ
jgi:3'-phosphoadenosine 5'-phosphosulfate sulfotransferase (PAPS reductase)/FAD synthetase